MGASASRLAPSPQVARQAVLLLTMSSDVGMAALAMAIVMLLLPRVLGPDAVDAELVKAGLCAGGVEETAT